MTSRLRWVCALTLALVACKPAKPTPQERTVERWLLCEECVEGELDSVVALGDNGLDALDKALNGPPADRVENMRRQILAMYERIPVPRTTRQDYVDRYLGNFKAIYHLRATTALARIGTPRAHAVLVGALQHDTLYREDVRRVLADSAGAVVSVVAADSQHGRLGDFAAVNPTLEVMDTKTHNPLRGLRVVFRVDSGGGAVVNPIQTTNSQGRAMVRWRLGAQDSSNVLRATVAGKTVRFRATGHAPGARVIFILQPHDAVRGNPMTPAPRVAVHDEWGRTQTNFDTTAVIRVLPLNLQSTQTLVNGVAALTGVAVPQSGPGFRLRVDVVGARPGFSKPFDVAP